jgi:hypothetical protein
LAAVHQACPGARRGAAGQGKYRTPQRADQSPGWLYSACGLHL